MLTTPSIVVLTVASAVLLMLIGGWGGNRIIARRLREIDSDLTSLDERFTRSQKVKAGQTLQDGRRGNMEEAMAIAAASKTARPPEPRMPGRASNVIVE